MSGYKRKGVDLTMIETNSMSETISVFRAYAAKHKTMFCSQMVSRKLRHSDKSVFDWLVASGFTEQDFLGYDDKFISSAVALAEQDGRLFYAELEKMRRWIDCCIIVIRPILRHFISQSKFRELALLLSFVPSSTSNSNKTVPIPKTSLEILLVFVEILGVKNDDETISQIKSLLEGFLSSRPDEEYLRLSVGCYLMHLLRGCVDIEDKDTGYEKALKLVFSWLVSSSTCRTRESVIVLKRVLGVKFTSEDNIVIQRFRNFGLPSEEKSHHSLMLLMAQELDLPLLDTEWERLVFASLVFQSVPMYWKSDNNAFSLLGLNICDCFSRTKSPVATAKRSRRFTDVMWHRMRMEYLAGSFTRLCKIAELDLMVRVCLIDRLLQDNNYNDANELLDITWDDCSLGMYLGERDIWNAPYNYIQFLFYYKVSKLAPHFNQWQNLELLNKLPNRGRDSDTLTCQELCIDCLLRNESTVPWNDIGKNDPELANTILSYNNLDEVAKHPDQIRNALGHSKDANLAGVEAKHEVFTQPDNFKAMHRQ